MRSFQTLIFFFALISFASPICHGAEAGQDQLIKQELDREDAGDFLGAIEVCKKILSIDSADVRTLNVIAGLYGKLGKFEEEIVWARQAIAINDKFHLAYINYGNALYSLGRVNEALEAFERAKAIAPLDPMPVYSLGVIAEEQDRLNDAIGFYQRSVALDSKFEPGLFNLAAMYANVKRFDDALATLDQLLLLNPSAQDAKVMRIQIESDQKKTRL